MCSRVLFLLALASLNSLASGNSNCDVTQKPDTWARIQTKHVFFNAWEPDNYLDLPGFCVNNDFMSYSLNYTSHVKLADPTATIHQDTATPNTFNDASLSNCGSGTKQVQWCRSHCADKDMEKVIVTTAIVNGSLPLAVAQQVFIDLGSPADTTIASLQVDLNESDVKIDYDYFDDVNFCSVLVKVKNPSMFPFAMFVSVQKIVN